MLNHRSSQPMKRKRSPLSSPPNHHRSQPPPPQQQHHQSTNSAATARLVAQIGEHDQNADYTRSLLEKIEGRMSNKILQQFKFPFIHELKDCYEKLFKIGQGTFGEVFKAKCMKTKRYVALKKILMDNEREGFPITAIREVKMLLRLRHTYITELVEICNQNASAADKSTFFLVFTFCNFDLAGLLSRKDVVIKLPDVKTMMKHLLEGLLKIHNANILHRDMKTANILISEEGILRLADFGLSRQMLKAGKPVNYTNRVVTLWYRPPELLLGSRRYGPAIDLWGAGCIMAELWTRAPIMQGATEQMQLDLIQTTCGGINTTVWPDVDKLPLFNRLQLKPDQRRTLRSKMEKFEQNAEALNLLESLLTLDPSKRPTAENAILHNTFFSEPKYPDNIHHILRDLPSNIFEYTAGRGAHANRRLTHQVPGGTANPTTNGVNRARVTRPPADQLHDVIY
ncbi:putative cyclin-dependent kinase 9 [Aphelenchoides besseyi]|nr:putative cyclin-dependent kinase 9 [Aphelenchoides besseyi]